MLHLAASFGGSAVKPASTHSNFMQYRPNVYEPVRAKMEDDDDLYIISTKNTQSKIKYNTK